MSHHAARGSASQRRQGIERNSRSHRSWLKGTWRFRRGSHRARCGFLTRCRRVWSSRWDLGRRRGGGRPSRSQERTCMPWTEKVAEWWSDALHVYCSWKSGGRRARGDDSSRIQDEDRVLDGHAAPSPSQSAFMSECVSPASLLATVSGHHVRSPAPPLLVGSRTYMAFHLRRPPPARGTDAARSVASD